jgi:hypothetical protein
MFFNILADISEDSKLMIQVSKESSNESIVSSQKFGVGSGRISQG